MIKQADEVKYVGDLAANVNLRLHSARDAILQSAKVYEERDVASIASAFNVVVNRVDGFMEAKRKNTLTEGRLAQQIFSVIREEEAIAARQAKIEAMREARRAKAEAVENAAAGGEADDNKN